MENMKLLGFVMLAAMVFLLVNSTRSAAASTDDDDADTRDVQALMNLGTDDKLTLQVEVNEEDTSFRRLLRGGGSRGGRGGGSSRGGRGGGSSRGRIIPVYGGTGAGHHHNDADTIRTPSVWILSMYFLFAVLAFGV